MVKIYNNRILPTLKFVKEGNILDIGCVGMGSNDTIGGDEFMHGYLKTHFPSSNIVGIDVNKKGIKELNYNGFNVKYKDAQEPYNLNLKFDTIISEENIEHISNIKTYLDNVRKHLNKNAVFIVTTPNIRCLDFWLQNFFVKNLRVNHTHTQCHTLQTIKFLLEDNGFKVVKTEFFQAISPYMNLNAKIIGLILRFFPNRFGRNIILVCKKRGQLDTN